MVPSDHGGSSSDYGAVGNQSGPRGPGAGPRGKADRPRACRIGPGARAAAGVGAPALIGLLLAGAAAAPSWAQARRLTGPEIDRLLQERTTPAQRAGQTSQSRRLNRLLGRDITYDEVLKDPDNVALNLAYARTQIRQGDVKGAAATLERILLVVPNSIAVRVLYAIVLFRLDNRSEAERELKWVLRLKLSPDLRVELESYLAEINRRNRRTRFGVLLHASGQYETNRNAAPRDNLIEGVNGLVPLQGEDRRTGDFAGRGLVRFSFEHDLRHQRRHRIFGYASLYDSEQLRLGRLTLRAADISGGIALDFAPVELFLIGGGSYVQLSHEPYLASGSFEARPEWRLDRFNVLAASFRVEYQHFSELSERFDQRFRTGVEGRLGVSWSTVPSTRTRFAIGAAFLRKQARSDFHQYYGLALSARLAWLVGDGMVLSGAVTYVRTQYDEPNLVESAKTRHQDYLNFGVTYSVPLSAIIPRLGKLRQFGDTTFAVSFEYEKSFSNIANYTYSNFRFTFGITKEFIF